eukprot:CAMPEP_0206475070 /NCGR_PEP_ID=MMETSP0324_2-20121206/33862_1 /ASSEMBLY_ACC=CAM_ASM_000836 /TAXON_ID=2866 /ORGANISM="Crypthecodinium cohnii, Strain Seligo" /LENGTH=276 /DNA_ID=CAMNT_0053950361 /DNA_START=94 /DNA_END=921 /DNA_ORIENTATION=-
MGCAQSISGLCCPCRSKSPSSNGKFPRLLSPGWQSLLSCGGGASRLERKKLWTEAGIDKTRLVVRLLSGNILYEEDAVFDTRLAEVLERCCSILQCNSTPDYVQLIFDGEEGPTDVSAYLGQVAVPKVGEDVGMTLIRLPGPPVQVVATSGRPIAITDVPSVHDYCHFDRNYHFLSLGSFAKRPNVRYLKTSNEDKRMSASTVMWRLTFTVDATVYLNFRSRRHVTSTGAADWLQEQGFKLAGEVNSVVSTGVPNGPYEGPVYKKGVTPGACDLMG